VCGFHGILSHLWIRLGGTDVLHHLDAGSARKLRR
jgi:hypothetical protein